MVRSSLKSPVDALTKPGSLSVTQFSSIGTCQLPLLTLSRYLPLHTTSKKSALKKLRELEVDLAAGRIPVVGEARQGAERRQ
ncbi:MAG: hypothetical protein GX590_00770 [Lentisphaerae bacterium]|nr:hypothetical protein [Lentisphaerota bacterium]